MARCGVIDVKTSWSTKDIVVPMNILGVGDASGAEILLIESFWRTGAGWKSELSGGETVRTEPFEVKPMVSLPVLRRA